MRALQLKLGPHTQGRPVSTQALSDTCSCPVRLCALPLQHSSLPSTSPLGTKPCLAVNSKRLGLSMGAGESRSYTSGRSVVVQRRTNSNPPKMDIPPLPSDTPAWKALAEHVAEVKKSHLKDLLADQARCEMLIHEVDGIYADFSRQKVTTKTLKLLLDLAHTVDLKSKIDAMFSGQHINSTEGRAVLHVATRARREQTIYFDGKNVVPDVWNVLDKIKMFSNKIRSGEWRGATGKALKNVVAIGIGGSFLGPLFVHTALKSEERAFHASEGRELRFLANVDPVDVYKSLEGLNPEETLIIVISKTFTTSETMLNARTARAWLTASLGQEAVSKHVVAVSTNLELVAKFGIDPENAFGFWDWVGGRYSVCSAVGILPLAVQYGFDIAHDFLKGANAIDDHFHTAPLEQNLPVMLGLFSVWHISFLGYPSLAILPYSEALGKFAPHIQQVAMESNGKGVDIYGRPVPYETGEVDFGEPGTNGQHSFYQLIHQGRIVPCDFIGFIKSQEPVYLAGEPVPNHDELISNFFAQPDALAYGKTPETLKTEGCPEELIPHKTFHGNRPSLSILLPKLDAYTLGQLLALYEHRVAVQGFVWGLNSFDQWGVELGKVLASQVRKTLCAARDTESHIDPAAGFCYSTTRMINKYLGDPVEPKPKVTMLPPDLLK